MVRPVLKSGQEDSWRGKRTYDPVRSQYRYEPVGVGILYFLASQPTWAVENKAHSLNSMTESHVPFWHATQLVWTDVTAVKRDPSKCENRNETGPCADRPRTELPNLHDVILEPNHPPCRVALPASPPSPISSCPPWECSALSALPLNPQTSNPATAIDLQQSTSASRNHNASPPRLQSG